MYFLLLRCCLVFFGCLSFHATAVDITIVEEKEENSCSDIHLGETATVNVENGGDKVYFRFVPDNSMRISFSAASDYYTFGILFDKDYEVLDSNDDGGVGLNFNIRYYVEAGEEYYFSAGYYDGEVTGSFNVKLEEDLSLPTESVELRTSIEDDVTEYSDFEYRFLEDSTIEISKYKGTADEVVIPSTIDDHTVTGIGKYAFFGNDTLESVIISNTVTYIDTGAFDECFLLKQVICGSNLSHIGSSAFMNCKSMGAIDLPNTLRMIDDSAFAYCSSLKKIVIPEGVTHIKEAAFLDCKEMKCITLPKTMQEIEEIAIGYDMAQKGQEPHVKDVFSIRGYQNTVAESYAKENDIAFVSLDDIADRAMGDCDGDGKITIMDATDIQLALCSGETVRDEVLDYSDIDKNGRLEISDATYVQRSVVEIKIPYTVGDKEGTELVKSVKNIVYDKNGEVRGESELVYEYQFDEKGNCIHKTHLQNGEKIATVDYVYNNSDIVIKELRYNDSDELFEVLEYNDDGLEISDTYYLSNYSYTKDYDSFGNQTRYISYRDGIIISDIQYTYEYDSNENIISSITYHDGAPKQKYEYEYDDKNNMIKRSDYNLSKNTFIGFAKYRYDNNHNLVCCITFDSHGNNTGYAEYWYDTNNNKIATYSVSEKYSDVSKFFV